MIPTDYYNDQLAPGQAPLTSAEFALLAAMTDLSQERWCATWIDGNEFELWEAIVEGPGKAFDIREHEVQALHELRMQAGCWFRWDGDEGLVRTNAHEMQPLYKVWKASR